MEVSFVSRENVMFVHYCVNMRAAHWQPLPAAWLFQMIATLTVTTPIMHLRHGRKAGRRKPALAWAVSLHFVHCNFVRLHKSPWITLPWRQVFLIGCGCWKNWSSRRRDSGRRGGEAMSINDLPAIMGTVLIVAGLGLVGVSTWSRGEGSEKTTQAGALIIVVGAFLLGVSIFVPHAK
ncbi:MAG TPA: hypothetical protein VGI20_05515 [Rhizomicrobium sp.]|jgi:hypothetical protein